VGDGRKENRGGRPARPRPGPDPPFRRFPLNFSPPGEAFLYFPRDGAAAKGIRFARVWKGCRG